MAKKSKYNPLSYVKGSRPGSYSSAYKGQIKQARNQLMNWQYDPLQDANYQALAKVYGARGNTAAKDTLADAAALNGGYGTSYAVSAAQQARNQYNQELAALVPDLEQVAYGRLQNNYNMLLDADEIAYNRYRDRVGDWQWGKGYDTDIYQWKQAQKKSSSGGGGGGRGGSGGGYYGGGGSGIDYGDTITTNEDLYNKAKAKSIASIKKPIEGTATGTMTKLRKTK